MRVTKDCPSGGGGIYAFSQCDVLLLISPQFGADVDMPWSKYKYRSFGHVQVLAKDVFGHVQEKSRSKAGHVETSHVATVAVGPWPSCNAHCATTSAIPR